MPIIQSSITYICMQVLLDLLERSEVTLYTWMTSLQKKLYKSILMKDTSMSYNECVYQCIIYSHGWIMTRAVAKEVTVML